MKILLHSPTSTVRRNGNRQTSAEWATMLHEAGHEVRVVSSYEGEAADLLLALHAVKSREAVLQFREAIPEGKVIVALTGTDIYPEPGADALDTMRKADAIITLQRRAIRQVPGDCRKKVVTVIQSAARLLDRPEADTSSFGICVVGHLRDVKDPLLASSALRELPASSRIHLRHAGGILDDKYAPLVAREEKQNPRYEWVGELSEPETAKLLASSMLMVLTSLSEGGARVVGEAVVHGTPVLSTRIDGVVGLLGEDYDGFFPVGDSKALTALLERCEAEPDFYTRLSSQALARADQFRPEKEREALLAAIREAGKLTSS